MSPLDRLRRQLDEQDAQEWEVWREGKKERDRAVRDVAIDRLLGAVEGRANAGRVLNVEQIRGAYRALRDADPPVKATKETTADKLGVHPDTIDRTLRDAGTTWRDLKRTA